MVRATVALPGLHAGQIVWTDPKVPFVAMCLRHGYVVVVEPDPDPADAVVDDGE